MAGKPVLVVDDDVDIRESLSAILAAHGYQVATATDGQDALDYLRSHDPPGLIILDWVMPRMDAPKFRARQRQEPAFANVPIVLLTGNARTYAKQGALDAVDYLAKPVHLRRLLESVGRYCR